MKIGIITMHRVLNIGSVLQAYATQKAFEKLGYDSELIDYMYISKTKTSIKSKFLSFGLNVLLGFPKQKRKKRLTAFYNRYFKCSKKTYNRHSIQQEPPIYDIYCTGSDQVWNPRYVKNDVSFMLNFVPEGKKKISYGSSFAADSVPFEYEKLYSDYLSKYDRITVREKTGVELVKRLTNKEAQLVCDPTLLLEAKDWDVISESSATHIEEPYILVYFLGYMFDPRPHLFDIINDVQKKLGFHVYYLNGGHQEMKQPNSTVYRGQGPSEFIEMIRNASFVITDSFHGTAFATIYNIPMMGIVKSKKHGDDRIGSLRSTVGGAKSIIEYDSYDKSFAKSAIDEYKCDGSLVNAFREKSLNIIKNMIEQ